MRDPVAESTAPVQPVGRMLSLVQANRAARPATDSFRRHQSLHCTPLLNMFGSELHTLLSTVKTSSRLRRSAAASQQPSSRCEKACSCGEAAVQDAQSCNGIDIPVLMYY
jgi:hypothetical protein